MSPKTYTFLIQHPGERGAGLNPYSETITLTVESGDPGGDRDDKDNPDTFLGFMLLNLQQWYEGASIVVDPCSTCGGAGWITSETSRGEEVPINCPTCGGKGTVKK